MTKANEWDIIGMIVGSFIFAMLKIFGYFQWSWWFVFSPIWFPIFVVCVYLFLYFWTDKKILKGKNK
jgi:hypothetical protein